MANHLFGYFKLGFGGQAILQKVGTTNNLIRGVTFFEHSGIAIIFVFMPIIAKEITGSLWEIGVIIASFSFAQILSELYFGRVSDKLGTRIWFIRIGFIASAVTFAMHYFVDDVTMLLLARVAAGIATGIMIPPMLAYSYEAGKDKAKVASVVSFHALGWLVGIAAAGFVNDAKLIFLLSSVFFIAGLVISTKLPNLKTEKVSKDKTIKKVFVKNEFLFLSLLLRHVGAASVWTILPIMLIEEWGAELYQVSVVYVANTLTAFVLMNLMASRIKIRNITKFKIGVGLTPFVFVGLLTVTEWWMAMPFMALVGATWAFLFIGGNFYLMENNNPKSTSTGIFSSTISIATVIGPVIAGVMAFSFGYESVMYFAIGIIVAAFVISIRIGKGSFFPLTSVKDPI